VGEVAGKAGEQSEPHGVDNAAERKEEAFDDWRKELVVVREGRFVRKRRGGYHCSPRTACGFGHRTEMSVSYLEISEGRNLILLDISC